MNIALTINLHSFVADPYRPEREQLINVQKESGMNRVRSSANRRKSLEEYLRSEQMTLEDYNTLVTRAAEPWDLDDEGKHIVIPRRSVAAMVVQMCDTARSAMRPCPPEMVRTVLRPTEWVTTAMPSAAHVWERYVVVTAGTGAKLSNQRGMRCNAYIGALPPEGEPTRTVVAHGALDINENMVRPEVLEKALAWAGEWVGIGASRKMGWGRFTLESFQAA